MEKQFLTRLRDDPGDDATRLVYSDWLDDQDDPVSAAKAEFLRLAVALAADPGREGGDELRERLQQRAAVLDPGWLLAATRLPIGNFHEMATAGWRVVRTGPVRLAHGIAIPAFIHNWSYHLTGIYAYADGAVDCWGFVDLPLFRRKVAEGWVAPRPPRGAWISIHNLGQVEVDAADWALTPEDLIRRVEEAVRELNSESAGLLDMEGSDVEVRNGVRYAKLMVGDRKPYRVAGGREVLGEEVPVFLVEGDGYRLTRWLVYADRQAQVGYGPVVAPFEAVAALFETGRLTTAVPAGAWVEVDGLGRFRAGEGDWNVEAVERVREARDLVEVANGSPGAIRRCIERHEAYQASPTDREREALRQAYGAVPEHLRMYCGDMDSKDGPIRQILGLDTDDE